MKLIIDIFLKNCEHVLNLLCMTYCIDYTKSLLEKQINAYDITFPAHFVLLQATKHGSYSILIIEAMDFN